MIQSHLGELAALGTAIFWTITSTAFEFSSRRIGSLPVNLMRLFFAYVFLSLYSIIFLGHLFPSGATMHNWIWLSVSGFVGFVLGDLFLFRSYMIISARISMLIMSLAPPIAAITARIFLGEKMSPKSILGMALTLLGIGMVVLVREIKEDTANKDNNLKKIKFAYPLSGILLAFGGAAGQGIGIVLSKYGMQGYNAFASTQIRIITGLLGFIAIFSILGRWRALFEGFNDKKAMRGVVTGSFFGPFLGVAFSLVAVQYTSAGIASTIMSIVPVLIIAPSAIFNKEKIKFKEIIGAVISVLGVSLFFI